MDGGRVKKFVEKRRDETRWKRLRRSFVRGFIEMRCKSSGRFAVPDFAGWQYTDPDINPQGFG